MTIPIREPRRVSMYGNWRNPVLWETAFHSSDDAMDHLDPDADVYTILDEIAHAEYWANVYDPNRQ